MVDPFVKDQDPSKGVMVFESQGLVQGTAPEQNAYEVIMRLRNAGRLTDEEIAILREYNHSLVQESSKIESVEGSVLQAYHPFPCTAFAKLLLSPPKEVVGVSVALFAKPGEDGHCIFMTNQGYARSKAPNAFNHPLDGFNTPKIQFGTCSSDMNHLCTYVDHIWDVYQLMTGTSIDEVKQVLE